tara:strand:- start:3149 stop:4714 length:1566 start_codon:yes stop_codon:yes gene_type:complete
MNKAKITLSHLNLKDLEIILRDGKYGFEKEALRIKDLTISESNHPKSLGSKLFNKFITTDFAESQLELITPPLEDAFYAIELLDSINHYIQKNIIHETFWPFSIPPPIASEEKIRIASFGSSNIGVFKHLYRKGLAKRYGKMMQSISGFHFNYSLPKQLWQILESREESSLRDSRNIRSEGYFRMLRNVTRMNWLVLYLFGASPVITKNFISSNNESFSRLDKETYYLPYATSLRMSDLGYQNLSRNTFQISKNSLGDYVSDLKMATSSKNQDFSKIDFSNPEISHRDQINPNFLQIEDEYYAIARPKSENTSNERSINKLLQGGVDFMELRSLDLNPFSRVGIDIETVLFLEVFLIYCFFESDDLITKDEIKIISENDLSVSRNGRDPKIILKENDCELSLKSWGSKILEEMTPIAEMLNKNDSRYTDAITKMSMKLKDPELTLSGKILQKIKSHSGGFRGLGQEIAENNKKYYLDIKKSHNLNWTILEKESSESLKQQRLLEKNQEIDFDSFLRDYFND